MRARADAGAHRSAANCRARATDRGARAANRSAQAHYRANHRGTDNCTDYGTYRRACGEGVQGRSDHAQRD